MNELTKKRATGVIVLILIGVLIPLLVTRCMHSGDSDSDSGRGSMRVYTVRPNGQAEPGKRSASGNRHSEGSTQQQASAGHENRPTGQRQPMPDTVSPQSPSHFSTPPVHGTSGPSSQAGNGASAQSGASNSAPANANGSAHNAGRSGGGEKSGHGQSSSGASSGGLENRHPSGWMVQTASFGKRSSAVALARKLKQTFSASYTPAHVNGKTWYRVNVGPFNSKKAAQSAAGRLKKQGHSALVRDLP